MKELRPYLLPLLVEARKSSDSSITEIDTMDSFNYSPLYTISSLSSTSEISSPVTSTFSARGHSRHPSSSSSLASSPVIHDQTELVTAGKSSLADVKEEPHEKEEGRDTFRRSVRFSGSSRKYPIPGGSTSPQSSAKPTSLVGCDLVNGFSNYRDFPVSDNKKARIEDSSPSFASRMTSHFPSISRRRKEGTVGKAISVMRKSRDDAPSRAPSTRSSSMTGSFTQSSGQQYTQYPPTPRSSFSDSEECITSIDIERAKVESDGHDAERRLASTPLLPPMMLESSSTTFVEPSSKSPLQSPTVAGSTDCFSMGNTPIGSPRLSRLPSPPLSTKPSLSSLHRQRVGQLMASVEVPPIVIADPNDQWANKLGHANYNIHPEPYVPEEYDLDACRQMRANWDMARSNYMKHLVRTGEHYGVTSKTYKLTEEKWAEVDAHWKKNHDVTITKTSEKGIDAATLRATTAEQTTKIPSLNGPCSDGKFPKLGDEDIVGPMVQIASQVPHRPSKRTVFLKFFQNIKYPKGSPTGRSSLSRQRPV